MHCVRADIKLKLYNFVQVKDKENISVIVLVDFG